jgi:hypothetical protein
MNSTHYKQKRNLIKVFTYATHFSLFWVKFRTTSKQMSSISTLTILYHLLFYLPSNLCLSISPSISWYTFRSYKSLHVGIMSLENVGRKSAHCDAWTQVTWVWRSFLTHAVNYNLLRKFPAAEVINGHTLWDKSISYTKQWTLLAEPSFLKMLYFMKTKITSSIQSRKSLIRHERCSKFCQLPS